MFLMRVQARDASSDQREAPRKKEGNLGAVALGAVREDKHRSVVVGIYCMHDTA